MLRTSRRIIAGAVLLFFAIIFIDFKSIIPEKFIEHFTDLQIVPTILWTIRKGVWIPLGLLVFIILTLLTGRTYCSYLCPLGILQDFFRRVGKKYRQKPKYRKAISWLRYSVLGAVLLVFVGGSASLLNLLDPYSMFGRIFTYLVQPIAIWSNNIGALILNHFDSYALYVENFAPTHLAVVIWMAINLIVIATFSIKWGRLYCNTICPVGTLLGFISKYSWLKVRISEDACVKCGKCERVCKSDCIDSKTMTIDNSRCVACFNCLDVCKKGALSFSAKKSSPKPVDSNKRAFFTRAVASSALLTSAVNTANARGRHHKHCGGTINHKQVASPPGSQSHNYFNSTCTGCSLCITECPTKVLQPSFLEYGIKGMMQPYMDFENSFCDDDCIRCGEVCPTEAIVKLTHEQKRRTQIGVARFMRGKCIVKIDNTECGACSEHCPTKAVHMVPWGNVMIPEVNPDLCIGCGACEYVCPTEPKAIIVEGLDVHQVAQLPQSNKVDIKHEEDFPF